MREIASEGPWAQKLADARRINVELPETYFDILAPLSTAVDIWETTYLHSLEGDDPVFDWVSGTGLRPFVQRLQGDSATRSWRLIERACATPIRAARMARPCSRSSDCSAWHGASVSAA